MLRVFLKLVWSSRYPLMRLIVLNFKDKSSVWKDNEEYFCEKLFWQLRQWEHRFYELLLRKRRCYYNNSKGMISQNSLALLCTSGVIFVCWYHSSRPVYRETFSWESLWKSIHVERAPRSPACYWRIACVRAESGIWGGNSRRGE